MSLIFQKPPFNYQYKVGIENIVDVNVTPATLAGAAPETVLQRLTVMNNVLVRDGQALRLRAIGTIVNATAAILFRIKVNGITIFDVSISVNAANRGWYSEAYFVRQGTDLVCYSEGGFFAAIIPTIANNISKANNYIKLLGLDFTQELIVEFTGDTGAAGDSITQECSTMSVI